ncbi:MAG: hypothetical protein P8Y70_00840 [Candidatus Lokiarchaeota archaeon]
MLRFFVYDNVEKLWKEEDILLFHDIVTILDEDEKVLYYWRGPKSNKKKNAEAKIFLDNLLRSLALDVKIRIQKENFPERINQEIQKKLKIARETEDIDKYKLSRFITIRLYLIYLIGINILIVLGLINLFSILFSNNNGSIISVSAQFYGDWLFRYRVVLIFLLVLLAVSFFIGLYEREYEIIAFSIVGILICIGILLLLTQGIFLFIFEPGSTDSTYLIAYPNILLFLVVNSFGLAIIFITHLYKIIAFIKTYHKFIF